MKEEYRQLARNIELNQVSLGTHLFTKGACIFACSKYKGYLNVSSDFCNYLLVNAEHKYRKLSIYDK